MDLQLNDKTALVTGSTGGIGLAIARRLAVEGAPRDTDVIAETLQISR